MEDCKRIIDRSGLDCVLRPICCGDNIELYMYALEKYNTVPTEDHLLHALNEYSVRIEFQDPIKGKIIDFILENYPETCTHVVVEYVIFNNIVSMIEKVRKILPGFWPSLAEKFKTLYIRYKLSRFENSENEKILKHLIDEGFRPEYYPNSCIKFNTKNIKFRGKLIEWNNLPRNQFIFSDIDTSSKIKYEINEGEINMFAIQGDPEPMINWLNDNINGVMEELQSVIRLLVNPIFAALDDIPSLKNIAKNVMGANGVSTKKIPSELF